MGNYTNAYATVTPTKTDLGASIDQAENQGFRYRAEQRLIEAEEQNKKDDRERKLKEFNDNSPKFVPTGVETEDEYMYAGVQNAANQLYEVQKQFNELNNKTNLTPDEERKLYQLSAKRNNLQNYPDNLKRMMESQTNSAKDYLEGIKKGTYLSDPNIDKKLSSALTGYVPGIDETGMPSAGLYDRDGDGIADVLSFEDVNNQLFIKPVKRNDVYASVSELAKTFKADETKTEEGYWTTENKYVDETQARATIKGMLDESAYATEAHRRGLPLDYKFSDAEKKKFEDELLLSLRNRVTESYTKTKDNADENADNTLDFNKKKQAEELAFKKQKEANDQKIAEKKLKIAAKSTNKNGSGKVIPTLDEAIISGVTVVNSIKDDARFSNKVKKGAALMTVTGVDIYKGKDLHKRLKSTFVNPDGSIVMQVEKFTGDTSTIEEITNQEDIMEIMGAVVKDYDNDGNAVTYRNYGDIQKDLANKAGIKINQKPAKGVGSKYN